MHGARAPAVQKISPADQTDARRVRTLRHVHAIAVAVASSSSAGGVLSLVALAGSLPSQRLRMVCSGVLNCDCSMSVEIRDVNDIA